jgi:type I restriction enzyme S subunit
MSELLQIEEIARIKQGRYTAPSELSEEPTDDAKVPVWGANGILGYTQHATYEEAQPLVTCRGNGCGLVQWTGVRSHVSNNAMAIVLKDVCPASSKYLYYSLIASKFDDVTTGSAQPQITVGHLNKKEIFWNSDRSERIAIAHVLGTLDDKIELNQKMNQTLEDIAKAIFKSWFVDFDPVRAKLDGRPTGLPAEISNLLPDAFEDSEIGGIPLGWKVSPLDSIGTFKNGLALQKYPPIEGSERLPVVKIAQLRKGSTIGDDTYASGVPDGFVIDDGDFVFSWSGTLMAKYWVGGRGALNQHLFKVEGQTQPLWMVAGWVEHFMPEFQSIAASKATTMGHIQREHLRQALCIIPPADVVDVCSAIITPIIERCVLAQQESKVLLELRDTLLPKLISGELCIPDAEKFIEEAGI